MTSPSRGGFAEYDDPDFDSEWFDDEAYDRALEGGYEEEPAPRGLAATEGRPQAPSAPPPAAAARARSGGGVRGALVPALVTLASVVLAVGAGFYVVVRAADSGAEGPVAEAGRRVLAALAVLRGEPATVAPAPTLEPTPGATPAAGGDEPASAVVPGEGPASAPAIPSPSVAAVASAAGPGPASGPLVVPPPVQAPGARGEWLTPPSAARLTPAPGVPAAAPTGGGALPSPRVSAAAAAPSPAAATARPAPRRPAPVTPTPGATPTRGPLPKPTPEVARRATPEASRTSLQFAVNVTTPSMAQVEQLWGFTSGLGARRGTLVVTARVGFGRFAPALARARGGAVAKLLERNTPGRGWSVELRVDRQVTRGDAGRQVDVEFVPTR
ncbi:MAG: hypothetical protein VKQ33_14955 [Candidatus Sericytochromatia bacterium]|nr:hypothetical protein [Candidatus Sericytochromatia bacterium]